MLHCHRLDHEDVGMMAVEIVNDSGPCVCGAVPLEGWEIAIVVGASIVGACLVSLGLILGNNRMQHGSWSICCGKRAANVLPA